MVRAKAAAVAGLLLAVGLAPSTEALAARNGRFLLFSAYGENTPYHVFKIRLDGTGLERLSGRRGGIWPSWSSDGRRIAYASRRGLVVMRADGSRRRVIARGGAAQWSPDDGHLVVERWCCTENPTSSSISVLRPDGTRGRAVATTGSRRRVSSAAWAPTDRRIAYLEVRTLMELDEYPRDRIRVVDQLGEKRRTLVRRRGIEAFDWSPDGRRIVFACRCGRAQDELFVVNVRNKNVTRITRTPGYESDPAWSPDGDRIVVVRWNAAGTGVAKLVTMDPGGSSEAVIAARVRGGAPSPAWSPDGDRIVFLRGDESEVFVVDEDGSDEMQVTDDRRDQVDPRWQPR